MDTATWTGISGKKYGMQVCIFGREFYKNPGVYVFCKLGIDGRWSAIYIGETEDFNDRLNTNLAQHHRWACIQREGATRVCTLGVTGGKLARTDIETDLRQSNDPPCNRQ